MFGKRIKPSTVDAYISAYGDNITGGTARERWVNFLAQATGKTGSLYYLETEFLKGKGYTGTFSDMVTSWVKSEDGLRAELAGASNNLIANPSFETNLTGWTGFNTTVTRDTTQFYTGVASMKAVAVAGNEAIAVYNLSYIPSRTYTISARVKGTAGQQVYLAARSNANSGANPTTLTGGWDLVQFTFTPTVASSSVEVKGATLGTTIYIDKAQLFIR